MPETPAPMARTSDPRVQPTQVNHTLAPCDGLSPDAVPTMWCALAPLATVIVCFAWILSEFVYSSFSTTSVTASWLNGRASVFETEGCGFEPRRGHFLSVVRLRFVGSNLLSAFLLSFSPTATVRILFAEYHNNFYRPSTITDNALLYKPTKQW